MSMSKLSDPKERKWVTQWKDVRYRAYAYDGEVRYFFTLWPFPIGMRFTPIDIRVPRPIHAFFLFNDATWDSCREYQQMRTTLNDEWTLTAKHIEVEMVKFLEFKEKAFEMLFLDSMSQIAHPAYHISCIGRSNLRIVWQVMTYHEIR